MVLKKMMCAPSTFVHNFLDNIFIQLFFGRSKNVVSESNLIQASSDILTFFVEIEEIFIISFLFFKDPPEQKNKILPKTTRKREQKMAPEILISHNSCHQVSCHF